MTQMPSKKQLIELRRMMRRCEQAPGMSMLDHGMLVIRKYLALLRSIRNGAPEEGLKIPDWAHSPAILDNQLPINLAGIYMIYHDCGKPLCRTVDNEGRQHFPGHADASANLWRSLGGDERIARLMAMDMDAHTLSADALPEFCARPEASTLLLAALAEVHANAEMFGGQQSISFKAKWKHLDRRGRAAIRLIGQGGNAVSGRREPPHSN